MIRWLVLGAVAVTFTVACGGDDDGGGSGGSSGGGGVAAGGTGGTSSGGAAGSTSGGSGGASTGGAGGTSSVTNCDEAAALVKSAVLALGCSVDNSGEIKIGCESLYAQSKCVAEWEALINCLSPKPTSDWVCKSDGKPEPNTCLTQKSAFDTCNGN